MFRNLVFHQFQIGMELHTGNANMRKEQLSEKLLGLMKNLQILHKQGFRNIHYDANGCNGKKSDFTRKYHALFDIVLYKP